MALSVTDTLTGEQRPFEPRDPDAVSLYYCGLTVSDPPHLGHARSWVHVDVMDRWLTQLGYAVTHVENFTDVNEKIVARIGEDDLGEDESAVARTYIDRVLTDMRALGLKRATVYPRVSDHVPEVIELIETLIEREAAYESNGSVYFDVTAFSDYGGLSNQRLDEIESQGDPDERTEKRHPADFALWKAGPVSPDAVADHRHEGVSAPDAETPEGQVWDSPWGPGRPGWHIECSAMSMAHLGETIDIHVGGRDLVFPHHENEIAQSEAATGERFARYWLHTALFETADEKMSSSLSNFITVEDAIETYGTNTVRTFLTAGAYNTAQTYSTEAIEEAAGRFDRLARAYDRATGAIDGPDARHKTTDADLRAAVATAREEFRTALNDDFDTHGGQTALLDLAGAINRSLDADPPYDYRALTDAIDALETFGEDVLGLSFGDVGVDTKRREDDAALTDALVALVLEQRERAREDGAYDRADALRDELSALGVEIEDTDEGPTYRY